MAFPYNRPRRMRRDDFSRRLMREHRLSADDLSRVVDRSWDPPVTVLVRLVSIVDDAAQHAGQAAYLRGLLGR